MLQKRDLQQQRYTTSPENEGFTLYKQLNILFWAMVLLGSVSALMVGTQ